MKDRSEVFSKFMSFTNEIQIQYSATLKVFQSDNALEYTSSTFKQYFHSKGIVHETSCAYTPQQNGVSEHKHRHLLEVTRSLMTHMSVPKHHWPEAFLTSCYLINRLPSTSINNKIPFQLLFPLFPLPLETFGCVCFVHILLMARQVVSKISLSVCFLATPKAMHVIIQP